MPTVQQPSEPAPSPEVARLVQEAVRAERERIAVTLHDTICQDLTGAYLMVCATARQCRIVAPEVEQKLDGLAKTLQEAGSKLKLVVHSLEAEKPDGKNSP